MKKLFILFFIFSPPLWRPARHLWLILLLAGGGGGAEVFAQQKYSRVKIYADEKGLARLSKAGVCIDHGDVKKNVFFISDFSEQEIAIIKSQGFKFDIQVDDVQKFYLDQNNPASAKYVPPVNPQSFSCYSINYPTPSNFNLGSMGGFFTYNEILNKLDSMAILFPNLVKAKVPISGTNSIEGRPIYWMKISDNPNTDENEPEMLYTAVHHAREPASISQLIMYMYYLLENYNSDPEVKYLVDNLEMYFVPVVNPDGYLYNQTNNPNGGGMWRKNRRDNLDGQFGIDLNRNYGNNWGFDDVGSSPQTSSDTYRGTAGFSEPETQNLRTFCNAHQFQLALNYHTYGNLLIYPWGYQPSTYTPDSATLVEYGKYLTFQNHYNYGTADQTVGYIVNGSSDDWMYGEQTSKGKIYAMTPEAGEVSYGFWPPQNLITGISKENIGQNLHAAHLLLKHAVASDEEPRYVQQTNGFFNYKIKRLGLAVPASFTVSIIPVSAAITSVGAPKTYGSLLLLQEANDSISFALGTVVQGQTLKYIISVNNGSNTHRDTITKVYGVPVIPFASNGNTMTGWTSTKWGTTTTQYYSAPRSITDSPGGDYSSNDSTFITTTSPVNLNGAISATLSFRGRWEVEPRFDYVEVLASTDNGSTWNPLCGKFTKPGTLYEDPGNPVYDGYQFEWLREEINMDAYINTNVLLRFMLRADNGGDAAGFYFDDLKVEKLLNTNGVNAIAGELDFSVYPTPASSMITVVAGGVKQTLMVCNILGEKVSSRQLATGKNEIDISSYPKGVYFIKVSDEKGNFGVRKIILQ